MVTFTLYLENRERAIAAINNASRAIADVFGEPIWVAGYSLVYVEEEMDDNIRDTTIRNFTYVVYRAASRRNIDVSIIEDLSPKRAIDIFSPQNLRPFLKIVQQIIDTIDLGDVKATAISAGGAIAIEVDYDEKKAYKRHALHGTNDEAGLGDMLDVL